MAQHDPMSPDATPGHTGVRRANNVPLYLLGAALTGFVGIVGTVAYQRAAQQQVTQGQPEGTQPRHKSALAMASSVAGNPGRAVIEAKLPPPAPAASVASAVVQVARPSPEDLDRPPLPPGGSNSAGQGQYTGMGATHQRQPDQQAEQMQQAKLQQFMAAVRADTSVQVQLKQPQGGGGAGAAPASREEMLARMQQAEATAAAAGGQQDPMAVYRARIAALQGGGGGPGGAMPAAAAQPVPSRIGMLQFDNRQGGDRWRLDATVEAPDTPYLLRAGKVRIPLILKEGINSELPGQITAVVTRNVYDTGTGDNLLIPQGTQAQGAYSSDVAFGQARVLIAIQRLIFPDDSTLDLGAMPGADPEGYAGLKDRVDNHYVRIFGSAFLLSGVTAGISYSQRSSQNQYGVPTFSGALSEAVGQQLGQATAQLLNKNMNVAPTLEIRPGYRFTVVVVKDLRFPGPYKGSIPRSIE